MSYTLTDSLIATLRAGGLTVGDANDTDSIYGTGNKLPLPHVVVYPGEGAEYDGTIGPGGTWTEIDKPFLPICVGATRQQAEWLADTVAALLLGATGVDWRARPSGGGAATRDDATAGAPKYIAAPRFMLSAWVGEG